MRRVASHIAGIEAVAEGEVRGQRRDERTITRHERTVGYLGPWSSTFTLAWLASHRDRLRTLLLGGRRLSILVVWDTEGRKVAARSEDDIQAIYQLVNGERP